ncbi:MarR family transcriptional regulator [Planctomonas sp. JC2975]|uniref:MarR family winged helix-turn-helix transcriptional regulator n=1 Tax=Planctomonas sp. JC2975 TaxID=2729626 RepID=UPI0014760123|nr:MarR family transcriptional regulator [Planctomonas sp. JC2975]NNC13979.1 MarR family transcriptional regulator [Planctomonas sp. JC2975]
MDAPREPDVQHANALLDPRIIDPAQELVSHGGLADEEIEQIVRVLAGIRDWREAEQEIGFRSRSDMKLNETDMKALRFLVAAKNQGTIVTPKLLSDHLGISTASTTKLLDRLAAAGHIERAPHPTDRRALVITITRRTHERVRDSVGRTHAQRWEVAASLTPEEREVVIGFLQRLAATARPTTGDGGQRSEPDQSA